MSVRKIVGIICFLLPAICSLAQAQKKDWDASWQLVDSLINKKGLTQSALKEVDALYARAKKEKNDGQLLKALIYSINLHNRTDENADSHGIAELEKQRSTLSEPSRSIVESLEAGMYWNYLQNNRYRFYNRSNTIQFSKTDIATWSLDDFHKKITELFLASIKEEKLLQETILSSYNPIIIVGNARRLRPTLYDLLVHRALDYFKNDERDVYQPANNFTITEAAAFGDALTFSTHPFTTTDTGSNQLQTIYILQKLIRFHSKDKDPAALIQTDIERVGFVYSHAIIENKEELYKGSLTEIIAKYPGNPIAAQASFLLASSYAARAAQYKPLKDTSYRYDLLTAKKICETVINEKDSSEGKANCNNLLNSILSPSLKLEAEKVNIPNQPFRMLVNFKNSSIVYFRIIRLEKNVFEALGNNSWNDDYWKKVSALPVLKSFAQPIPDTKDFQYHATEIKIDSLPVGEYAIVASLQPDFSVGNNFMALQHIYVSNISYVQNARDYFVLNRETGQPLAGTDVQAWYKYYDSKTRMTVTRKGENFNTGKNGFFTLTPPKSHKDATIKLEFSTIDDHLFVDEERQSYEYYPVDDAANHIDFERKNLKAFLFTDRSIYRPGQLVYFKGILVTKDAGSRKNKIVEQFKNRIYLVDENGEHIDSLNITTNEFGSYHGSFKIPENRLNGLFNIEDDSTGDQQSFSVEEYKRPKFYAEYDTLKKAWRLNDSILVMGSAKAYAGNTINGAQVKYRITRNPRIIFPWLFEKWGRPSYRSTEITNGSTTTDENGHFSISFKAIPDASIDKRSEPVFDYQVSVDITDINGETRSAEKTISIGYHSIIVLLDGPDEIANDSLKTINASVTSVAGATASAFARITIYQLKTPSGLIRKRYWEQPDQFVINENDYRRYFPYDEYSDETNKDNWERTNKVFESTDSIRSNTTISLGNSRLQPGWYWAGIAAKDPYGDSVTNYRYIHVYDAKSGNPGLPAYNWTFDNDASFEPGNTATVRVGSSANNVFVIQKISRPGETGSGMDTSKNYQFITLNNDQKLAAFPIQESDRGGFGVDYVFVKNNRVYFNSNSIGVPWTNKELNIDYTSFRDKTLPGAEEKWKLKITGYKKDKVTAEVLAAMYDASLDQFKAQSWSKPDLYPVYTMDIKWSWMNNFSLQPGLEKNGFAFQYINYVLAHDELLAIQGKARVMIRGIATLSRSGAPGASPVEAMSANESPNSSFKTKIIADTVLESIKEEGQPKGDQLNFQPRKNFNETAFFFPDLKTDSSGTIEFSFTMPEALTQWKWMSLAHTKDLAFGYSEKTIITQKQLMVQPNPPRFLREGDHISFVTKIVNMTDSELTGQVGLQLFDPTTNQPVDGWFQNMQANQYFTVPPHQSVPAVFTLEIPFLYNKPIDWRILASTSIGDGKGQRINLSDGEEAILPVLSNRMLVTESLPLNMKGAGKKSFSFDKLLKSGSSETLSQHALTVEFTSNPAWYAVQALPYLIEYPYECAEQTFNRFYANALAATIANSSPRIREIFEKWKTTDTAALLSNLQKNQELKSVLLEETPWVLQAKTEAEQKRNIALLFDMVKMNRELESSFSKLADNQNASGGFPWFTGGPEDRYITQYILTGIGRLQKLKAIPESMSSRISALVASALAWLDKKTAEDYQALLKQKQAAGIDNFAIQYLYMRSFFSAYPIPGASVSAINYYRKQAQQNWVGQNKYMQGMIALSLFRTGDIKTANDILASLKQNAIISDEMGMYWKEVTGGYYWWQAPVETQSLLIETFSEIGKNNTVVNSLKTWLLKQKQTQNWPTTKATADACYALLLQGTDWLSAQPSIDIQLGDKSVSSSAATVEAGTGYFKKTFDGPFVNPGMGAITVTIKPVSDKEPSPSWGGVYWQYFENLDKITGAATPLRLNKKLFISKNTSNGPVLEPLQDNANLRVGDKVIVRIELRSDRNMEYLHLKDTRASCMEPVNVLSAYKWQDGLGYYESTKDVSTDFFIGWLSKGTYVFEYPLFVAQAGSFSNGITTIQSMYAPEFSSHSEGIHINVEALP